MPVDDKELESEIARAQAEHQITNDREVKLRSILKNFQSIKKVQRQVPNTTGGFDIREDMPIDLGTHKEFSVARRDTIFNENKALLDTVIGPVT